MPHYDTVIKGGTVFDGLQTPRFKADIAIKDGRIAQIGSVDAADASEVVEASGKHVARRATSTCTRTTTASCFGTRGAPCPAGTG